MMTSQILRPVDLTKTQKLRYLENETLFFLQVKNSLITHQELIYCKKKFCSGVCLPMCSKIQCLFVYIQQLYFPLLSLDFYVHFL